MNALDLKLLRDMRYWWGQILAIALVVACGIASFVSMQSAHESLRLSQSTYYEQYRFAEVFAAAKRVPDTRLAAIQAIPGVAQVQTRVVVDVTLDIPGRKEPGTGRLVSIPEQQTPMLNDIFIRKGRYIEAGRSDEVLASEAFAKTNHLQLGDTLGAVINGRWQKLRIVGFALSPEYVYEIRPGDFFPDNQSFGVFWMGREALGNAFNLDGAFNDIALSLMPRTNPADVIFRLDQMLSPYGSRGAYEQKDQVSNRFLSDDIAQSKVSATIMSSIFLGIGAFLLHILLSRLISTQRDQIAVLKAFGYSNGAIGWHFLKFVFVIVGVGAGIGIGLGLWLGVLLTGVFAQFYQFPTLRYAATPAMLLTAIAISGGSAILGAFAAVQRAVSLPPAEAMRPEPPPQFRSTMMERLGLQAWLSPVMRIILRNLERKPVQSGLSVLGITIAVAILVLGRYSSDAIQYLIQVQFYQLQRDDMTLVFNEPRPARTRYEVEHLPGVLYAEPFRSVGAKLRFEHRDRQVAIMGLQPQSDLRRLLDRHLNTVYLPSDGLLLSTKLAEVLGVTPGEPLTVEVQEGARPTRTVPVAGTVDELLGVSAYMDIQALHRLMQEGDTISGAFLAVDSLQLDPLYTRLKQTPAVASIAMKRSVIERFQKTIAQSQSIMMTVQIIFASVIAFGVIYNTARIAFSERSRELATLRIIGFTKGQIAIMLLGEQAMITLAAIPPGLFLGYLFAAAISRAYDTELYRFPLIVAQASYVFAVAVVLIVALLSAVIVRRQLAHLDLIAVLKTRE
jgi:putative ABC transport system permease protein